VYCVCIAFGFNYDGWRDGCYARARLGYQLSQELGVCGQPRSAEGVGLEQTCDSRTSGAGRIQTGTEATHFYPAEVLVSGPTLFTQSPTWCTPGTQWVAGNTSQCLPCEAGTVNPTTGSGNCTACEVGFVAPTAGE
jgi:hypothetical protein